MRTPNACSSPSLAAATSTRSAPGPPAEAVVTSRLLISSTKQEPILLTSPLVWLVVLPRRCLLAFARRSGSITLHAVRRVGGISFVVLRRLCSRSACRPLPHLNLSASTPKGDFVHHQ